MKQEPAVNIVITQGTRIGKRALARGDKVRAEAADARLLVGIGRAEYADADKKQDK